MRIPTLAIRSLTLAIGLGLTVPSIAFQGPAAPVVKLPSSPLEPGTLIAFGDAPRLSKSARAGDVTTIPASALDADTIDSLSAAPPGGALAMLSSHALPLSDADALVLKRLFDGGVPFLLHIDSKAPEHLAHATSLFGIAPTVGQVLLRRDPGGHVRVFSPSADSEADAADLLSAMLQGATPDPSSGKQGARIAIDALSAEGEPLLPSRHFDVAIVDAGGEVSGVTGIDVVRSRTASSDNKIVTLTSKVTLKTAKNGILDGSRTKKNLWAAYMPLEYRLRHGVTIDGATPTYLGHFPETDGRTEFTQVDTENRGFTIGGSTGSELSSSGKPDDVLAAKVPFNLSFGYEHKWQTSLSVSFKDYSMLAVPGNDASVQWKALIAPTLKHVLIKRWGADMPQLTEDRMTPMMRTATFNTMSQWKIPGAYEGMAKVSVLAGYALDRKEWWWERTNVRHRAELDLRDKGVDFTVDMSDPYVTAEITVLIRSATGSGACLRDKNGSVELTPCNAMDRRQMWGLDASSRYVNRGSGRCLSVQPSTRGVITDTCANVTYEKQWQWRADRLHSLVDHGRYRLYVESGSVHYHAPEGRFQDYPVNPFGSPLEPWTNYPNPPRPGIDFQPAPAGSRPLPVGEEWGSQFRRVSDDQRWRIEVLRQGL